MSLRAVLFPDAGALESVRVVLQQYGWETSDANAEDELLERADLVVIGSTTDPDGIALTRIVQARNGGCPVMLLAGTASQHDIAVAVERLSDRPETAVDDGDEPLGGGDRLIGVSLPARAMRDSIRRAAATDSNVLITGETGTGKELVAELIHRNSARAKRPMVCINCAAIPDTLLESELFGYERGAFTGAVASTPGKLEQAAGGTIFFDEIGDMSPYAQAKILRAIESREVHRLGGRRPVRLDVRVIAATNRDLDELAMTGAFRSDLYFRLNVARVQLAPLRERQSDIPLLIDHYVREFNRTFRTEVRALEPDALARLLAYEWPGNVRELRNVIESAFGSRPASRITWIDLPEWLRRRLGDDAPAPGEEQRILTALAATNWNKSKAAEKLQWSRMTLYRKLAKYQIGAS